ncbi:epithelial cell adhesion molecule isoform X2 [Clupea harengus]|uniref:Epithelial cell adhesion molecule isoform X2 n=1 Tax=Clupea harengus TaxID=7950 RepID=A0A6P8G628_CLUHA|nr:epithelial cell adhesion molecule isoform X2 [Clupea harengus]XP_042565459.1 epithelial cell adhesion molecule isoform X2 [Clupea harengus]
MKLLIALTLVSFAVGAFSQCTCPTSKWAVCDGTPCQCTLLVGDNQKQAVDCTKLIPKCFLMKTQMQRARTGTIGSKPVETALVDDDWMYDPDCEVNGKFKARQCNGTEECWCVNSAGVRRTDKGDKNLKCDVLVETYWLRMQMTHKELAKEVDEAQLKTGIENAILARYKLAKTFVKEVQYDKDARMIIVDVKKDKDDTKEDLTRVGWYMEKDIKELPQFNNQEKFEPMVGGQKMEMDSILVYYVDAKAPTFTMKHLTGGVIAVIVVVILAVVAGLLVLFFLRRREQARYSKAQPREMDNM